MRMSSITKEKSKPLQYIILIITECYSFHSLQLNYRLEVLVESLIIQRDYAISVMQLINNNVVFFIKS